ncbi:hypothetical protein ABT052_05680 [Streptomyces sp. NPDC002766]|uniref:hypothetical protein n=1 Tax=Streptomyces sp. NPDC002766 TaxID=3154429 RepID=UPI0033334C1B
MEYLDEKELHSIGPQLGAHVLGATRRERQTTSLKKWWMEVGDQWVIVQVDATEVALKDIRRVSYHEGQYFAHVLTLPESGLALYHYRHDVSRFSPHIYIILRPNPHKDQRALRLLRGYVRDVHVQRESLYCAIRITKSWIETGAAGAATGEQVANLERFLRRKIAQLGRKQLWGIKQDLLLDRLFATGAVFSAPERHAIYEELSTMQEDLAARLEGLLRKSDVPRPPHIQVNGDNAQIATSGGSNMSDQQGPIFEGKYSGMHVGTAGNVGDHGTGTVNVWQNMSDLARELDRLREELARQAADSDQQKSVTEVELARDAAQANDENSARGHLKKAGRWVLDVARQIGLATAEAAVKSALGLP